MAKRKKKGDIGTVVKGVSECGEEPDWGPLENVLPWHACNGFMWMYEVELETGTRLQVYKHGTTRGNLHLSAKGEAYSYVWDPDEEREFDPDAPSEYRRVELHRMIAAVLGTPVYPAVQADEIHYYANGRSNVPAPGISIDGEIGGGFDELDQPT